MEGLPGLRNNPYWENATDAQRAAAKDAIVRELVKRTGLDYEDVNKFVKQWSESSNDNDMRSLAIQRDAADVFDMPLSRFTADKIGQMEKKMRAYYEDMSGRPGAIFHGMSFDEVMVEWQRRETFQEFMPLMPSDQQQSLIRAMRDYTQEEMGRLGYGPGDTVRLRRGIQLPAGVAGNWSVDDYVPIDGNALESWSVSHDIAGRFAGGYASAVSHGQVGVVLEMDVPVRMIVGSSRSGFGCLIEGEFVVQGLPSNARIAKTFIGTYGAPD